MAEASASGAWTDVGVAILAIGTLVLLVQFGRLVGSTALSVYRSPARPRRRPRRRGTAPAPARPAPAGAWFAVAPSGRRPVTSRTCAVAGVALGTAAVGGFELAVGEYLAGAILLGILVVWVAVHAHRRRVPAPGQPEEWTI